MRNLQALTHKRNLYVLKFFVNQAISKVLRVLLNNQFLGLRSTKLVWSLISQDKAKTYSLTRIKDRCFITGSARSYVRLTGLSRHFTKEYLRNGSLPNLSSVSW